MESREYFQKDDDTILRGAWPQFSCHHRKGSMTQELWGETLRLVAKEINRHRGDLPALILCDNPKSHENIPVLEELLKQGINVLFFPHNTSHFLQPLDGAPFAQYKKLARNIVADIALAKALGDRAEADRRDYVNEAETAAFTPKVIKSGFSERGVWPFDKNLMRSNLKECLRSGPSPEKTDIPEAAIATREALLKEAKKHSERNIGGRRRIAKKPQIMLASELVDNRRSSQQKKSPSKPSTPSKSTQTKSSSKKKMSTSKGETSVGRKRILEEEISSELDSPQRPKKRPALRCSGCDGLYRGGSAWVSCNSCHNYLLCKECSYCRFFRDAHGNNCEGTPKPPDFVLYTAE